MTANWRPSSVDGAGFQNAMAISNPAHGHTANVRLYAGDVAGFHLSTDGGLTWKQANAGLTEQWHRKIVAVEFDRFHPNCVLAYFSNGDLTDATPADDIGRRAGLLYGVIDPVAQTIAWTILFDQAVTNNAGAPAYPAGLYPSAADGAQGTYGRQTGRMIACDPFTAERWYIGTRQGIVVYTRPGTTCTNLTRNAVTTNARDMVTSVVVDPNSTSTNTILWFTIRSGTANAAQQQSTNGGLNRRTGAGPAQTNTVSRISSTQAPDAEGAAVVSEAGSSIVYVAANTQVRRYDGTAWTTIETGLPTDANRHWHSIDAVRLAGDTATRVVIGHYGADMTPAKVWWSDNGGTSWSAVGDAKRAFTEGNASGDSWWLAVAQPYYALSDSTTGYDSAQLCIRPDSTDQVHTAGRSGGWRTDSLTGSGVQWYPSVRGLTATVAMFVAPHPTDAQKAVIGDTDWSRFITTDRLTSQPVLDERIFGAATYGVAWNASGTEVVTAHGDRNDNILGGVSLNANVFGAGNGTWVNQGFSTQRCLGVALGVDSTGTNRVTVAAVEGLGIQRAQSAGFSTAAATPVTASSAAVPEVGKGFKAPVVWPGATGPNVYAYIPASTATPGGVWRSTDYGVSWGAAPIVSFATTQKWAAQMCADPTSPTTLYFTRVSGSTANDGVWRITNANGTPTATRILALTQPGGVTATPSGRVYAAALPNDSGGSRLMYTDNPSAATPTWTTISDPFLTGALGYAHHLASAADGAIYIAKTDGGYLVSPDPVGGGTFTASDVATASDAITRALTAPRAASDTLTVADTPTVSRTLPRGDSAATADAAGWVAGRQRAQADTIAVGDAVVRVMERPEIGNSQFVLDVEPYVPFGLGQTVVVEKFSPGSAELRAQDIISPTSNSRLFGSDLKTPPTWSWDMYTDVQSEAEALGWADMLERAWDDEAVQSTPNQVVRLRYKAADRLRCVFGRPGNFTFIPGDLLWAGKGLITADFRLAENLFFEDGEDNSGLLRILPDSAGPGWRFPIKFPVKSAIPPAGVQSGVVNIGGKKPTPLSIDFHGPVVNPWVRIGDFQWGLRGSIAYDQTVTMSGLPWDMGVRRSDGTWLPGMLDPRARLSQLRLPPGLYPVRFGGFDPTGSSSALVRWRDAYGVM